MSSKEKESDELLYTVLVTRYGPRKGLTNQAASKWKGVRATWSLEQT